MEPVDDKKTTSSASSSWFSCCSKCFVSTSPKTSQDGHHDYEEMKTKQNYDTMDLENSKGATTQRKRGGWAAMPFILGTESFERLASIGLVANFQVFLMKVFHLDQVGASNFVFISSGVGNFAPLIGAYIADAYAGRFVTIAFASIAAFMGMLTMTLIAWLPELHPLPCNPSAGEECSSATTTQMGVLALSLVFLTIGTGGIRPCNIPFGVDQFDSSTEEGRKGINSFFNWYYTTFTVVMILALTLIVYIQDAVSWALGYGIPTILMAIGIVLLFIGTRIYVYVKPEGSVFSGIAQTFVAAYKKRKLEIPHHLHDFYDPQPLDGSIVKKLALTNQFRCLNKGAIIREGDVTQDGKVRNQWRLVSVQQIEQVKCLLRVVPVWASGIICFMAMAQQGTFTVSQALKMDRHLGSKFQIPAGSLAVISMITIGLWLPIYDRILVPALRKVTKIEGGITLLQRMGIGIVFSILSMIVAGVMERKRRASALEYAGPDGVAPMSVLWLAPQLIIMGFAEAFNIIGQIEFYNKEFPENMSSLANSLFACTMAGANYISSAVVNIVHKGTATRHHPDWLTKDINAGRVENFYFIIAGMGVFNLIYFLVVARKYRYKSRVRIDEEKEVEDENHVELKEANQ